MNKVIYFFSVLLLFTLLGSLSAFCDSVTLVTYFPAPSGRYQKISVAEDLTMEKTATAPGITTGTLGDKYVWYTNNSNNLSLAVKNDDNLLQVTPIGAVLAKGRFTGGCVLMTYGPNTGAQVCRTPFTNKCAYDAARPELGSPTAGATGFFTCCKTAALCN